MTANAPCDGPFKRRILAAVEGIDDLRAIEDRVRAAPGELRLPARVSLVEQIAAGMRSEASRPTPGPPGPPVGTYVRQAWEDEDPAPPPWTQAGMTRTEWLATCETASGGAS